MLGFFVGLGFDFWVLIFGYWVLGFELGFELGYFEF